MLSYQFLPDPEEHQLGQREITSIQDLNNKSKDNLWTKRINGESYLLWVVLRTRLGNTQTYSESLSMFSPLIKTGRERNRNTPYISLSCIFYNHAKQLKQKIIAVEPKVQDNLQTVIYDCDLSD